MQLKMLLARLRYRENLREAQSMLRGGRIADAWKRLSDCDPDRRHWEWHYLRQQIPGTGKVLYSHGKSVACLAVSSDGRLIASAARNGSVRLWHRSDSKIAGEFQLEELPIRRFRGGKLHVVSRQFAIDLEFSRVGGLIAARTNRNRVVVWSIAKRKVLLNVDHAGRTIRIIRFTQDGKRIFTVGNNMTVANQNEVREWVIAQQQGRIVATFSQWIKAIDPTCQRVVIDTRKRLEVWRLTPKTREWWTIPAPKSWDAVFSMDGKTVLLLDGDRCVFHDAETGQSKGYIKGTFRQVGGVAQKRLLTSRMIYGWDGGEELKGGLFAVVPPTGVVELEPVGRWCALAYRDRVSMLSVVRARRVIDFRSGISKGAVSFSPDGKQLAVLSRGDGVIDVVTGNVKKVQTGSDGTAFSRNGNWLVCVGAREAADDRNAVEVRDARTGTLETTIKEGFAPECLAVSPTGNLLALSRDLSGGTGIILRRLPGGELVRRSIDIKGARKLRFSPDGSILAAINWNGQLAAWEASTGRCLYVVQVKKWPMFGRPVESSKAAVSYVGVPKQVLAATNWNGQLAAWEVVVGRYLYVAHARSHPLFGLTFDPSGTVVAVSTLGSATQTRDARNGKLLKSINGINSATEIAYSPDGRRVAAIDRLRGRVVIWDAVNWEPLIEVPNGTSAEEIAFSPDGKNLATQAIGGGSVVLYRVPAFALPDTE